MAAPSSIALGRGNDAGSLVAGTKPAVLIRSGSIIDWTTLIPLRRLRVVPARRTCAVGSLSAVDIDPAGHTMVGVLCRPSGVPGVLVDYNVRWHLSGCRPGHPHRLAGGDQRSIVVGYAVDQSLYLSRLVRLSAAAAILGGRRETFSRLVVT